MSALLSLDTLSGLSGIFIFLFVWVLIYGVLSAVKPFGNDKEGMYAIIALAMGVLVGMNSTAIKIFSFFTSWFSILIILIFFILLAVMVFGVKMDKITQLAQDGNNGKTIIVWIIIIAFVIMAIGLSLNVGQGLLEKQDNNPTANNGVQTQGSVSVVDPNTGATSQYDYDYRTDRGLQETTIKNPGTTTTVDIRDTPGGTNTGNYGDNFVKTLFHPKVLGLMLFMLIGLFASLWLTEEVSS